MKCRWLLVFLLLPWYAWSADVVRVGAALFPPYIENDSRGMLRVELLELMNRFQNKYEFRVVQSNPSRRFVDFDQGVFDVSFFDSLEWGWGKRPVEATPVFITGSERYVALARPERDQSFFADFAGKRMIGMRGYHYGFAKFNADPAWLAKEFNMALTTNNEATIRQLLAGNGDVALVTEAYLNQYLKRNPNLRGKLLVGEKPDQEYRLSIVTRQGSHPSAQEIFQILQAMQKAGVLKPLWERYGAGYGQLK